MYVNSYGLYLPIKGEQGAHCAIGLTWCYLECIYELRGPAAILLPPCQRDVLQSKSVEGGTKRSYTIHQY